METICKKCIKRGDKRWTPVEIKEYKKIFSRLPWLKNNKDKKNDNTITNIAGQLQLIEFFIKLNIDCEISLSYTDYSWVDEITGGTYCDFESEIGPILTKQIVCAIGAVVEAICYVIIKHNNIDLPKTICKKELVDNTNLSVMLNVIKEKSLLPKSELDLCFHIKELRNRVHLINQSESDVEMFDWNYSHSTFALECLYFLLQRWLNASDNFMQVHFPYIPIPLKREEILEESRKGWEDLEEMEKQSDIIAKNTPQIFFIQLGLGLEQESLYIIKALTNAQLHICHPAYLEYSSKKSLAAQLTIIEKFSFPYVLIFGKKESLNHSIIIRNMTDKSQKTIKLSEELVEYLKKLE
ncbi:MAG: hypothetical protein NTX96_00810 [Candidatus Zambryskibacteria bacterium]|nr:hypothetical protein [Candidatus Zambryskibacteria bacterium]